MHKNSEAPTAFGSEMFKISRALQADYDVGIDLHRHAVFAYVSRDVLPAYFVPYSACAVRIAQRSRRGEGECRTSLVPVHRESCSGSARQTPLARLNGDRLQVGAASSRATRNSNKGKEL
jgi:hypothetical protein